MARALGLHVGLACTRGVQVEYGLDNGCWAGVERDKSWIMELVFQPKHSSYLLNLFNLAKNQYKQTYADKMKLDKLVGSSFGYFYSGPTCWSWDRTMWCMWILSPYRLSILFIKMKSDKIKARLVSILLLVFCSFVYFKKKYEKYVWMNCFLKKNC